MVSDRKWKKEEKAKNEESIKDILYMKWEYKSIIDILVTDSWKEREKMIEMIIDGGTTKMKVFYLGDR